MIVASPLGRPAAAPGATTADRPLAELRASAELAEAASLPTTEVVKVPGGRPPSAVRRRSILAAAPEAPTKPVETPVEVPTRQEPPPGEKGRETPSDPDIDEQIKRIIREIPDPRPQPGGE